MKYNIFIFSFLLFLVSCNCVSASWLIDNYDYRKNIILTGNTSGAQTDYQILLNVTYESEMQSDFDDLRFCNETHQLDAWLESKVDSSYAFVWVEFPTTPANGVNQTYYMYYGNTAAVNDWDIGATFLFGDDFDDNSIDSVKWNTPTDSGTGITLSETGGEIKISGTSSDVDANANLYSKYTLPSTYILEYNLKTVSYTANSFDLAIGIYKDNSNRLHWFASKWTTPASNALGQLWQAGGTPSGVYDDTDLDGAYHHYAIYAKGSNLYDCYIDGVNKVTATNSGIATTPQIRLLGWVGVNGQTVDGRIDNVFVRKYAANPPTYACGSESYYVNSIHYNITNQYNHTIQSDGTIIVNRSITAADDINWTAAALTDDCNLVVTEYNLSNTTVANFTLYNAPLNWLKATNLTVGLTYELTNSTLYEHHIADGNGEINFTNNLIPDDYQIMAISTIVNITCYSVYPETLFTNYTGLLSGSYIVESNIPLNYKLFLSCISYGDELYFN
jgi:hypothetical protein